MLTPRLRKQLDEMNCYFQDGVLVPDEIACLRLASLVTPENARDVLDALPPGAVAGLREGLLALAERRAARDHLYPEGPCHAESEPGTQRASLSEFLLRPLEQRRSIAHVVVLPSFEPQWAIRLMGPEQHRRNPEPNSRYSVVLTQAQHEIHGGHDPLTTPIELVERRAEDRLGDHLQAIWDRALSGVRYPHRASLGHDGEFYHFGYGSMGGNTWSPQPGTIPGMLVEVTYDLRRWIRAADQELDAARQKLDASVDKILGALAIDS